MERNDGQKHGTKVVKFITRNLDDLIILKLFNRYISELQVCKFLQQSKNKNLAYFIFYFLYFTFILNVLK